MEAASLALAAVSTLELCLKYGKQLLVICREHEKFDDEIDGFILTIEGLWLKTEMQIESLRKLWKTLKVDLQLHYADSVKRLRMELMAAAESVFHVKRLGAIDAKTYQKVKAIYLKQHLKKIISGLENWQRRFDPSWYLITRIVNPLVDEQLKDDSSGQSPSMNRLARMREAIMEISSPQNDSTRSIFVDKSLVEKTSQVIPGTLVDMAILRGTQTVLLDRTNYSPFTAPMIPRTYVRDLARLLSNVDPMAFGLLKCEGVIELPEENINQFQFVFGVPKGLSSPRSLRSILMEAPICPLNYRIQLSQQLARSVMFVHTSGFVHKNIRPETILVFKEGPSFLSGFERVRRSEGQTDQSGDLEWTKNLYRHPVRQGLWPEEMYSMQHDIYSLGVCLLELGLWHSFVNYIGECAIPCEDLKISNVMLDKDQRRLAFAIKKQLVHVAQHHLPSLVGEKYTSLTTACLNCLDNGDGNTLGTQIDPKDKDGIVVGVRYIEKAIPSSTLNIE